MDIAFRIMDTYFKTMTTELQMATVHYIELSTHSYKGN